ncbi:hypothetical protein SEA_CRACKLEWINK_93 [Mycobacterium phage Cracklewink]|nr:hypothetical protein SEA_CRACKLEWINK_93 [Mycobacterium phage Cracklewink]
MINVGPDQPSGKVFRPLTPWEQRERAKLRLVRDGDSEPRTNGRPPPPPLNWDAANEFDRSLLAHLAALRANGIVGTNEVRELARPVVLPPGVEYRRVMVAKPVQAEWSAEGERLPVRQLETLLFSWRDRYTNRPVVEPWMTLHMGAPLESPADLPVNLRPDEAGKYWVFGREVYLWTGGRYAAVTLPPLDPTPPPAKVLTTDRPLSEEARREVEHVWSGEMVAALQPPPPPRFRNSRHYQQRDLAAIGSCPRCGEIDVHWLRPPDLPHPEPVPAVIRECRACGQEWGEK